MVIAGRGLPGRRLALLIRSLVSANGSRLGAGLVGTQPSHLVQITTIILSSANLLQRADAATGKADEGESEISLISKSLLRANRVPGAILDKLVSAIIL